jgi:membrane-associated PAP2 superfamily phosphatase
MNPVVQAPVLLQARAAKRIAAALAGAAVLIFWLGRRTDIDLLLADAVFDAGTGQFPWRHAWLAETFNHVMVKQVLVLAGIGFVLAAALDAWRGRGKPGRDVLASLRLRIVALSALLVPLLVSALKQASDSHCPWDLARYGGTQPYVRLLESLPAGAVAGHCLPAGHASGALWLVALAVFWLPARPRRAAAAAMAALLFGAVVGWLQQLRGAHFLTHTLWSIWIACALVLVLVLALQAWQARRPSRDRRESKICN